MHARKKLLQLLAYFSQSDEKRPAERFPSLIISECLFDSRFVFKRSELNVILSNLIDYGYNPLLVQDDYERILLDNVLQRI